VPQTLNATSNVAGLTIANNSFTTTAVTQEAIHNGSSLGSLIARRNWWGSVSGPSHPTNPGGTGAKITDRVVYAPWLGDGTDTSPAVGFQPNNTLASFPITVAPATGLTTTETGGTANFSIVLTGQPTANVTIGLTSSNTNEAAVSPASVTFTPGNYNTPQTVTVTGNAGAPLNGPVPYQIVTGPAQSTDPAYSGTDPQDVSLTNLPSTAFALAIADASIVEGNSGQTNLAFAVTLSQASTVPIVVGYASADGTASAGSDYTATNGSLTFNPGETSKTINVPVTGDVFFEPDETLTVTLSNPTAGVTLSDATATGTITNDDPNTPTLSIADASVTEGNSGQTNMVFTVTLIGTSNAPVTVNYATANGTAAAPGDFTATNGSLSFALGETTKTINVPVIGDTAAEGDETLTVTLSGASAGSAISRPTATGIIKDDEGPAPTLSIVDASVTEGTGGLTNMTLAVTLGGTSASPVTVNYATADGTATAPSDYTSTSGTLTFAPGETTKTIDVPIVGDSAVEGDETLTVTLSGAPSGVNITRPTATGIIKDDDTTLPASACAPRPRLVTTPVAGGGKLSVHLEATPKNTQENNVLTQITFGTFQNAKVTFNGQQVASGQTITLPANTVAADFTVERVTPGQATTVPFTVVDGCGPWPTFVGGGASAGF